MGSNQIREGVTKLSHGGSRILDIKIWGGRTNLNHTTPRSQSRWGSPPSIRTDSVRQLEIITQTQSQTGQESGHQDLGRAHKSKSYDTTLSVTVGLGSQSRWGYCVFAETQQRHTIIVQFTRIHAGAYNTVRMAPYLLANIPKQETSRNLKPCYHTFYPID